MGLRPDEKMEGQMDYAIRSTFKSHAWFEEVFRTASKMFLGSSCLRDLHESRIDGQDEVRL
jgi:hypothetical protein